MKNEQVTKQDFQSFKKELFDNFACQQDLENIRKELLENLVNKDTHKKYLAKLATKDELRWESYEIRKDMSDF